MKKIIYCLFLLFPLLSIANTENEFGILKGRVTTNDGKPASSVTLQLAGSAKYGLSNEHGYFMINKIKPGRYSLEISLVGYQSWSKNVTIEKGKTLEINIQLELSEKQLEQVIVIGSKNKLADKESENIARMPLRNLENPQVYNIVPKELLTEQVVTDYRSSMKNIAGTNSTNPPNGATFIRMRGFYTGSYVRNGMAAQQYVGMDPINIERIEAIKGPSGTLFGSSLISFGGLTNRVTKKPFDTFKGEISYSAGSWGLNRITTDINTPVNKDKTALLRLNAAVSNMGSFQDYGFEKTYAVAPSFLYKASERLTFLVDMEFYSANRVAATYPVFGTGLTVKNFKDLSLDYKNSLATNDEMIRQSSQNIFAQAIYKLSDRWTSVSQVAVSHGDWSSYSSVTANWITDTTIRRSLSLQRPRNIDSKNFQQNFNGDFYIGNFRNRILAGIDVYYNRTTTQTYGSVNYDTVKTVNSVIRPISMARVEAMFAAVLPSASVSDQLQYAAYVSDVFNITDRLNIMLSLRADRFENKGTSSNGGKRAGDYSQTALSPKAGVVYQLIKDRVSLFGNYMNGFQNVAPITQPDGTVTSFKAQQANQWEGGIKAELLSHKLNAVISYYDIKVKNSTRIEARTYMDINNQEVQGNFTVQDGTQRSRGIDAEIIASPVAGLNILAGYGYNDIRFVEAAANVKGKRSTTAPLHMGNFWISYKFHSVLKGLGLGTGGNYIGQSYWDGPNTFVVPEYTTLDATIFYETSAWRFAIKANNITNQKGWSMNGDPIALNQLIGSVVFRFN